MHGDPTLAVLDVCGASAGLALPVGVAAFAAGPGAVWCRDPAAVPAGASAVLVVLAGPLARFPDVLRSLPATGRTVVVALADSGGMPVADLVAKPEGLRAFYAICRLADAAIATSAESEHFFRDAGMPLVEFIPPPCPVDDPRWDLSVDPGRRRGILIGTADFVAHYRNHAAALLSLRELAVESSQPVTVVRTGGIFDRRMLRQVRRHWPPGLLRVVSGPLAPARFARLMAAHKLVFQLEWAGGAGDVAATALLCRIPCVGGHGAVERIAFPGLTGFGRTTEDLLALAAGLLRDAGAAADAVAEARARARTRLAPDLARSRLVDVLGRAAAAARPAGGRALSDPQP